MKSNKKFIFAIIFIFGILLSVSFGNSYMRSSYGSYSSSSGLYGDTYVSDSSMCEAGQDFIIQVSPLGCSPTVVRSDLLEEQNVPVFCQLVATKINPLIEVEAIDSISFSGDYPEGVSGVGFHPAQAALGTKNKLNSAVLENIGYVVVVLEKQKNASAMPDYVEGTLTASISYDIEDAYGIGKATFYLPVMSDEEWEENKIQYSFWKGRGYLKAEDVEADEATISIYDDTQRISTVSINEGETSNDIYLPGFDCFAGLTLKLTEVTYPSTKAKFEINGDIVEAGEGESFLDGRCTVRSIQKQGLNEKVQIRCKDDEGVTTFNLMISPKIKLSIDGEVGEYSVGEKLYASEDIGKNVYLGYIGTAENSVNTDYMYVRFYETPQNVEILSDSELSKIARYDSYFRVSKTGHLVKRASLAVLKGVAGISQAIGDALIKGNYYTLLRYKVSEDEYQSYLYQKITPTAIISDIAGMTEYSIDSNRVITLDIYGKDVSIVGFAEPVDSVLSKEVETYSEKAMDDYDTIIKSFSGEKENPNIESEETLGEKALLKQIDLAKETNQKKTLIELCEKFKSRYPDSNYLNILYNNGLGTCDYFTKLSTSSTMVRDVTINGQVKTISFEGIYEPSIEDYSAEISISGTRDECESGAILQKNEEACFSNSEYIKLTELSDDYAIFEVTVYEDDSLKTKELKLALNSHQTLGKNNYDIRLNKINLKKVAVVHLTPNIKNAGTETNFTFKIGIEQRTFLLSPEKRREQIKKLDKIIEDWGEKSEQLGTFVKGMKTACLFTGLGLTLKNFISNTGGMATARQQVMRGDGGWNEKCASLVSKGEYSTLDECFVENSEQIDNDVEAYAEQIDKLNNQMKTLQEKYVKEDPLFGGTVIDTDALTTAYLSESYKSELKEALQEKFGSTITVNGKEISTEAFIDNLDEGVSIEDLRNLQLYSRVSGSDTLNSVSNNELKSLVGDVYANTEARNAAKRIEEEASKEGLNIKVSSYSSNVNAIQGVYYGDKISGNSISGASGLSNNDYPISIINFNNEKYLLILEESGTEYAISEVYNYEGASSGRIVVTPTASQTATQIKGTFSKFVKYNKDTYENEYKNPELKYYETEPFKGYPALVPFDTQNGWYAHIKQTTTGVTLSYDESGRVNSFYVCNVGENGLEENTGGDDICEMINAGTGQAYNQFPGLDTSSARNIINNAVSAIEKAQKLYKSGISGNVNLGSNARSVPVGEPAVSIPELQCQDLMSPSDCQLLFNVCDPVICPSSRCNYGGTYPVRDVVQSGIVGSLLLCLPNYREGIYIPVCLTGIKAGIDGYLSVLQSYRNCLQESLDTGEIGGICDQIYSIHLCDFFWRQILPLTKVIVPKTISILMGQDTRGGGEYLTVQSAWENAEQSSDYFIEYYAANSAEAFKARVSTFVSDAVCQNFISASYPSGGELIDELTNPDSPPQYHGNFEEIEYTTATNPPLSHYKVYYHIYAGENARAYYKVYLKGSSTSSYYRDTSSDYFIDSGYIAIGEEVDKSPDFVATSGYKQLCISVNGQEECGFNQVSTSYALNYFTDKYVAEQANATDIKTESECISGSVSAYTLLNLNLAEVLEDIANPSIYDYGIIRICATENPGLGTDANANTIGSRWVDVGYCDDENMRCWVDTDSVKNVVKSTDIEDAVLESYTQTQLNNIKNASGYFSDKEFETFIDELEQLEQKEDYSAIVEKVNSTNLDKAFLSSEKARLYYFRANAYYKFTIALYKFLSSGKTLEEKEIEEKTEEEIISSEIRSEILTTAGQMDGIIVPSSLVNAEDKPANSNCYTGVLYVYQTCGESTRCVYSDGAGTEYNIEGKQIKTTSSSITTSTPFQVTSNPVSVCILNSEQGESTLSEEIKLDGIQPGDLLSYVYDSAQGHNAIFIEWIDKGRRIAKTFDWNGERLYEGQKDSSGTECTQFNFKSGTNYCKTYGYNTEDLSDDSHPVYMYWRSSGRIISRTKWTLNTALTKVDELLREYGDVDYSDEEDVKTFIDELCVDNVLDSDECDEVKGAILGFGEENLAWVQNQLKLKNLTSSSATTTSVFTLVGSNSKLWIYRENKKTDYYIEESDDSDYAYDIVKEGIFWDSDVGLITSDGFIILDNPKDEEEIEGLGTYNLEGYSFVLASSM